MGNGIVLSSSHLFSATTSPSFCPTHPAWALPHRRLLHKILQYEFLMNCSIVGPIHRLETFSDKMLQCGSPTQDHTSCPHVFQCRLLSPWSRSSFPSVAFPGGHSLFSGIHLPHHGVPTGLRENLCSPFHGLLGHSCLTMVCTLVCVGISFGAWTTFPPSSLADSDVCRIVFLTCFTPLFG